MLNDQRAFLFPIMHSISSKAAVLGLLAALPKDYSLFHKSLVSLVLVRCTRGMVQHMQLEAA